MSGTIFRVEKNKNYTVMSNHHLKDKNLSLKAKGLLSVMLSLPDDWDYSEKGLMTITGEGRDSIRGALRQLEAFGYLVREQVKGEDGRFGSTVFHIFEKPVDNGSSPLTENPSTEKPSTGKPSADEPSTANPTLLSTNNNQIPECTNDLSINPSGKLMMDGLMDSKDSRAEQYERCVEAIRENVSYGFIKETAERAEELFENDQMTLEEYDRTMAEYDVYVTDRVIKYIADLIINISGEDIMICGEPIPRRIVASKLLKAGQDEIRKVVWELKSNPAIKNEKQYTISMLYNL